MDLKNGRQVNNFGVDTTIFTGVLYEIMNAANGLLCFIDFIEESLNVIAEP